MSIFSKNKQKGEHEVRDEQPEVVQSQAEIRDDSDSSPELPDSQTGTGEAPVDAQDQGAAQQLKTGKIKQAKPKPGLIELLAGETGDFVSDLEPYLPAELIGGSVPQIPGTEEEAVWNAATQACGTEKVHFTYTVDAGRCWYLACPSYSLASHPESWCPLAAALPGKSEHWDTETVYLYEQEGQAGAMRWDPDTGRLQVFLGAARTILPRVQSMDANFVTIDPEIADIVPWQNRQLKTEKLSRAVVRVLIYVALLINIICIAILGFQSVMINTIERDLDEVRQETERASTQLMLKASKSLQSDVYKHLSRIQQLLDDLSQINGTLVKYEVKGEGKIRWEALVPASYKSGVMSVKGEVQPGVTEDGRVRIVGKR
jgi:hypothetical protein